MNAPEKLEELLLEYSAGTLSETPSILVATHLALSPASRKLVRDMEEVAGALFSLGAQDAPTMAPMDGELLSDVRVEPPKAAASTAAETGYSGPFPEPLASYLGHDAENMPWRRKLPGLKEFHLPPLSDGCKARIFKIRAGRSMPLHTHDGDELTLVLEGGFSDQTGSYRAGDVALADPAVEHRPFADPDGDCICLVVTDGPLRLTGPFGRLLSGLGRLK